MSIAIHQIGPGGYWTGHSDEIAATGGCPQGWTRAPLPALGPGEYAVWAGGAWQVRPDPYAPTPAPEPVPASVTRRQAKLALLNSASIGLPPDLLTSAEAAIAQADEATRIEWNDALEFRRDHPLILGIGAALGLTAGEIDALFRFAGGFA